ncbi:MAG: protein-disulfide reductase DsbD family protein [Alphaproteobacteria bacterium]
MRRLFLILLAPIFGVLVSAGASANPVQRDHVRVTLISEASSVRPGDTVWVALRQEIKPDWHTYWINPGDSGVPTTIAWTLPPGAEAGPIVWPAPIRFPLGHLVNFGYAGEVWLLTEIKVPAAAATGVNFDVTAQANWLACAQICVPEEASLSLSIPLATETRADSAAAAGFAKARAALPQPAPWPASYAATKEGFRLALAMPKEMAAAVSDSFVFPEQLDAIENGAAQKRHATADGLAIDLQRGVLGLKPGERLTGVVELTEGAGGGGQAHRFAFAASPAPPGAVIGSSVGDSRGPGLPLALLLAFAGGLILNLMPCVFPILSMKAVGLVRLADQERRAARGHGLVFGVGVVISFAVLAGVLIALRAGGTAVGWGFQLQTPWFVLFLSYLMFALGLNLSGIFRIGGAFAGAGGALASKPGKAGAFFTGMLAVLVATPCTAPFMGAALGFALAQPALPALAVFLALGTGMAAPYVLLSLSPALLRRLPKPGPWMERFRQLLAFPMYATAAWLVWVLGQQSPVSGIALALGGFILIGFAVWLVRQMDGSRQVWRTAYAALAAIALGGALSTLHFVEASAAAPASAGRAVTMKDAEPWSTARLDALRAEGRPVLVNFTAAWCITCLVNEKAALSTDAVQGALKSKSVAYLKGDWTRQDPAITAALASFGRSGVPLYVLYPPGGEPIVLPQILTASGVLAELNRI